MISIGSMGSAVRVRATLRSMRPALRMQCTERLIRLLLAPDFHSSTLNSFAWQNIGHGRYYYDLELLIGDKLSKLGMIPKARCRDLYLDKMRAAVIQIYEEVLRGKRGKFPQGFWMGWQGKLNMVICFRYLLEEKLGLEMDRKTRRIDPRLFRKNQKVFLEKECGKDDWVKLLHEHRLDGGFQRAFCCNITVLIRMAYPWAFNMRTPEETHLHWDEFRSNQLWIGKNGNKNVRRAGAHKLERHIGLIMDTRNHKFDPRLLRENHAQFLAEKGYPNWRALLTAEGFGGLLASKKDLHNKIGNLLRLIYPWAFDWSKPEGEHLHPHDFDDRNCFPADEELRAAILHETQQEGWAIKELSKKVTKEWLRKRGLNSVSLVPRLQLFRRAFAAEFITGIFSESDFTALRTTQKGD